jgi:serine/threonine-protein kinase
MERESWQVAKELFGRCLDASDADRARWIAEAEPAVGREVLALLDALAEADGFLPAGGGVAPGAVSNPPPGPGDRVGAFVLGREIGRGGMGAVFQAERSGAGFAQTLAVKVIPNGARQGVVRRRFRVERQALAALTHPNICLLVDQGTTEEGHLFLVMEYVDGEPLLEYCQRLQMGLRDRLRLFQQLCSAVHFAHQHLVLHCDLKPANVLVRSDGTPKLLDFGIAKLLGGVTAGWKLTETKGWRPMTPAYASPEQLAGERLTTATDIYSLGLLLFELLAGSHPYANALGHPIELLRAMERQAIPAPSAVAAGSVRYQLSGDLDSAVLKAMSHEPKRRYSSAADFAADVERYLTGLPLLARRASWLYRLSKLARRHMLPATVALALLLLGGTFAVQRLEVARQRDHATEEQQRADATLEVIHSMLSGALPDVARGDELSLRQLLAQIAEKLATADMAQGLLLTPAGEEIQVSPGLQAELLQMVGDIQVRLGNYQEAEPALDLSLSLRRSDSSSDSDSLAAALVAKGNLARLQGRFPEARELLLEALELRAAFFGADHPAVATVHQHLGGLARQSRDLESASRHLRTAARIYESRGEEHASHLGDVLRSLASVEIDRKQSARAFEWLDEADRVDPIDAGVQPSRAAVALAMRGIAHLGARQLAEAEAALTEAAQISRRVHGPRHPTLADILGNLATAQYLQGHLETAKENFLQAVSILEEHRPEDYAVLAERRYNLGAVHHALGNLEEAGVLYQSALEAHRSDSNPNQVSMLAIRHRAAMLRADQGDLASGLREVLQVLAERRRLPASNPRHVAGSLADAADLLARAGRDAEAEAALREALEIRQAQPSPQARPLAEAKAALGVLIARQGCSSEARRLLGEGVGGLQASASTKTALLEAAESALVACRE